MSSRAFLRGAVLVLWSTMFSFLAVADDKVSTFKLSDLKNGDIVLLRHANAPGVGDPDGFKLGDCSTQRNLDDAGRAQSQRFGELMRANKTKVGEVWSSQWCRTRETAALAFPELNARGVAAFNSFFAERGREPAQAREARTLLKQWRGTGVLVVVTHQVNITSLTNVTPASGEAVVVRLSDDGLRTLGRFSTQ